MAYKWPVFEPLKTPDGIWQFFKFLFGKLSGTNVLPEIVLDVTAWDMDATASLNISYPSTLNYKRVIGFRLSIFNDDESKHYDGIVGGIDSIEIDATDITITRTTSGTFDGTSFNDSSLSIRGKLTLCLLT
jgi:hypothetical protein|tara:strand:- start:180 stop:572 length:393 start_codon:yes stop_codon:yes gene_type:complete